VTDGLPGASVERLQIPDLHRRARTQRFIWAAALLGAAVLGWLVYRGRAQPVGEAYRTVAVTRRDVVRMVEATGHLDARARFEVPAPFAGRLTALLVRAGDRVTQGQPLARLDDRAGVFAVRNAGASQDAANAKMAEARSAQQSASDELSRVERLSARGLASSQELAAARSAVSRAESSLDAAKAERSLASGQLASARFSHGLGEIEAPVTGVVLSAPENLGSAVTPERALFVIGEPLEQMRVDVDVSEADIGEVKVGQKTGFEVQTFPGRTFEARVDRVGVEPRREAGVVTYPVRLLAENPERVLLPGMTAAVHIEVAHVSNVLAVRDGALRFTPAGAAEAPPRSRLFRRVGPAELEAVPVEVGLSDGVYTEVRPRDNVNLSERDQVAVGLLRPDAAERLQPGISLGGK
jgi:HlyD family secretion protein